MRGEQKNHRPAQRKKQGAQRKGARKKDYKNEK
jgi:hypothetical protein